MKEFSLDYFQTESPTHYSSLFGDTITSHKPSQLHDDMYKSHGAAELVYIASHDQISTQTLTDEKVDVTHYVKCKSRDELIAYNPKRPFTPG